MTAAAAAEAAGAEVAEAKQKELDAALVGGASGRTLLQGHPLLGVLPTWTAPPAGAQSGASRFPLHAMASPLHPHQTPPQARLAEAAGILNIRDELRETK